MRCTRRALVVALLVLPAAFASAEPGIWTPVGPTGVGWILDVAVGDGGAYAATFNGVFRSADGGATWEPAGLQGTWIADVETHPGTDLLVVRLVEWVFGAFPGKYGYAQGHLLATYDRGETWEYIEEDFNYYGFISAVAFDPSRPSTVYTWANAGIWRSTDSGETWSRPEETVYGTIYDFAIDPLTGTIYAMTDGSLMKSIDGASSWSFVSSPLPDTGYCGPNVCPGSVAVGATGTVYAAREGLFCRSADSAATWSCSTFSHYPRRILEIPAPTPGTSSVRVLVASDGGVFSSDDGGAKWSLATGELGSSGHLQALTADPTGTFVLAGTDTGIYRTTDQAETWAPASSGLRSMWNRALAIDPSDPKELWTGGAGFSGSQGPGLFRSSDRGLSWLPVSESDGPRRVDAIAIDPRSPSTIYAGGEAVYRTNDDGAHWTSSAPPGDDPVRALAVDPFDSNRVLAGTGGGLFTGSEDATGGRLFLSEDAGESWDAVGPEKEIYSLLFDHRRPGTIYAGSYFDLVSSFYYPDVNGGSIYVSGNNGESWLRSNPQHLEAPVSAFAADPFEDGVVYAGLLYGQIYRSADYGASWEKRSEGPGGAVYSLVADPIRHGHVYAATSGGVYLSTDGASTWQPLSSGLPSGTALVISPDGRWLHAGTGGAGVFRLDLQAEPPSFPCVPSATRLCLVGSRYALQVTASRDGQPIRAGEARPLADNAGYFALAVFTGDPELPEVIVKMLPDGTFGPGAPIFYSSMTTLPFTLTVTDTVTGSKEIYRNDAEAPFCGGVDLAFGDPSGLVMAPEAMAPQAMPATAEGLRLLGGRFELTLAARHATSGRTATGHGVFRNERFGYFSFPEVTGDAEFPEVVVKMIDFRWLLGSFALFHADLTSFDYTLTVTDTETGSVTTYESGTQFCGEVHTLRP